MPILNHVDPGAFDDESLDDESIHARAEFITGSAGTGKTTFVKNRVQNEEKYGILCATTGIAAVNLGSRNPDSPTVTTINSLLQYFDTESLEEKFVRGKLNTKLREISKRHHNIVIDEVSMMDARQLDIIYDAIEQVNRYKTVYNNGGLGLVLTGDFCQLPPVKGNFAFKSKHWSRFNDNITRLQKVWRHSNSAFLAGINAARRGDGDKCVEAFSVISEIKFRNGIDVNFDGTTIFSRNDEVDRMNLLRLDKLILNGAEDFEISSYRWGQQRKEWSLIPDRIHLAINSYIMILSNDTPSFTYANGSCGTILDYAEDSVLIKLASNNQEVSVSKIIRKCTSRENPEGYNIPSVTNWSEYTGTKKEYEIYLWQQTQDHKAARTGNDQPYYDFKEQCWVIGEINYLPIRLAYASTCHKCQGLTLDKIQIDLTNAFFNYPSMCYVGLSRVKNPEGLTIVGSPKLLASRCNILEDVLQWI